MNISFTITLSESEVRELLETVSPGNGDAMYAKLESDPVLLAKFTEEMQTTNFNDEIIQTSDQCSDWVETIEEMFSCTTM